MYFKPFLAHSEHTIPHTSVKTALGVLTNIVKTCSHISTCHVIPDNDNENNIQVCLVLNFEIKRVGILYGIIVTDVLHL